jgi:glucans biosynthesis protein
MIDITRRNLIAGAAMAGASPYGMGRALAQAAVAQTPRFGFEDVIKRARELARAPFEDPPARLPPQFDKLDYDAWRDIRFRPEHALLNGSGGFRLETFHLGFLYRRPVTVNTIRDGIASPIPYSSSLFDYGRIKLDKALPINTGFAGFRLHFPLNDPHVYDEVISFLGASYFRFLGRDQKYGLSARALCVEAGTDKESFPFFREFWLETPATAGGNAATIYALLDGEAATGAFRFDLTAGQDSFVDVQSTLFARRPGVKFGLAPLTSMYLSGENDRHNDDGFRGELHDSDGLSIQTGAGEWLWRPLRNPPTPSITSFLDENNKGFGLLQRDRTFESYQDLELAYEARPSYFVEPQGSWSAGRVELIELQTADETNDNIVTSWTPAVGPEPGKPYSYAYRVTAFLDVPRFSPNGRVVNTFKAPARALGTSEPTTPNSKRFLVDFAGGDLSYYVSDPAQVEVVATATNGQILRTSIAANPHIDGLRVMFDVAAKPGQTADLRLFLRAAGRTLTETWTFPWTAT